MSTLPSPGPPAPTCHHHHHSILILNEHPNPSTYRQPPELQQAPKAHLVGHQLLPHAPGGSLVPASEVQASESLLGQSLSSPSRFAPASPALGSFPEWDLLELDAPARSCHSAGSPSPARSLHVSFLYPSPPGGLTLRLVNVLGTQPARLPEVSRNG